MEVITYCLNRGDIAICKKSLNSDEVVIKRVLGIPGDRVDIINGSVYVNGYIINEDAYVISDWSSIDEAGNLDNYLVKDDEYFILGDNRIESVDSRHYGNVDKSLVIGKVLFRYAPVKTIKLFKWDAPGR